MYAKITLSELKLNTIDSFRIVLKGILCQGLAIINQNIATN
jgi:hypothetical protein